MLNEKMGKVAKGEKKKRRKEKCSIVFIVLKILCWWSLKSKEVNYWYLKMENLCADDGISCLKDQFFLECSTSFGFSLFFYLTITLAPLQ